MRRAARGFSLVEILFSMALFGIIVASLAAIQETALKRQGAASHQNVLHNNATMTGQIIRKTLASASHIQLPAPPTPVGSNEILVVWENSDAEGKRLVTTNPDGSAASRRFTILCRKQFPNAKPVDRKTNFYLYQGTLPDDQWVPDNFADSCGNTGPGGASPLLVAGELWGMVIEPFFFRPNNSQLQVSYRFCMARPGDSADCQQPELVVAHRTELSLRGALNSP